MKYLVYFCMVLAACQAQAQFKMVQGKIYSMNDPAWTTFNCSLEVIQASGNDLICRTFTTQTSTSTEIAHYANPRAVITRNSYRVYGKNIALRNYSSLPIGYVIDRPIPAIYIGKISIASTEKTGGMINSPVKTSRSYELYDVGTDYFPPKRPLTPEEKKAQIQKNAEAKIKALESDKVQASNGVANAQCRLGLAYLRGQGVETNRSLAIQWLGKASFQGNVQAQEALKNIAENTSTNSP